MNFFEKEMRQMFDDNDIFQDAIDECEYAIW